MTQVSGRITIHAPADAIWQVVGDFGAACQDLALVINCTVEGTGIGARRTLTYADGSVIVERLETFDEAARRLSYVLLTDTPFRDCLTSVTVRELGVSRSELAWTVVFEPDGLPADEALAMLEGALAANCAALKQLLER